jgi:hypothetical protein
VPWALGPPDGRYMLRQPAGASESAPGHVLVLATLGAPERRRSLAQRRRRKAEPEPEPSSVATGRATVIDVAAPLAGAGDAQTWLARAGEDELAADLAVLNQALHAFRLVTADPSVHAVTRRQLLMARIGYGAGEQVADGLWTDALELLPAVGRETRSKVLHPQARLAAVLNRREPALVCEELVLRARNDLDHGRDREAALQLLVALDAALAELAGTASIADLGQRLTELRAQRDPVAIAAQAALAGPLSAAQSETVAFTVGRIEAALRARAVANA